MSNQYGEGVACSHLRMLEKEKKTVGAQYSGESDKMVSESLEGPERPGVLLDHIKWG